MGNTAVELIDDLARDKERTVIIIEHRLEDVLHRNVDRIVLMADGRIAADMTPDELLKSDLLQKHGIREPALRYGDEIRRMRAGRHGEPGRHKHYSLYR